MSRGPRRKSLDWDKIEELLNADCKTTDIAAAFGVSDDTIRRRCKEDLNIDYTSFCQQKKAEGDNILRNVQYKLAKEGNVAMLVWLGKQRLGQSDKTETEHSFKGKGLKIGFDDSDEDGK